MRKEYGYAIPGEDTGECWAISAHANGDCTIQGGKYHGIALSELWKNHRELFGNSKEERFPLLVKIIDAKTDLSIQVHPDDAYAKENENGASGKTECWYILDCDEEAQIVIGHNAKDKQELRQMIEEKRWGDLIKVRPVKKGDFFQIEPGTVHAIKAGTLILETQQSSDVTYRLYDYGRLQNGKPRELHIEKSIDVIRCPHVEQSNHTSLRENENASIETLVSCRFYEVEKITVNGKADFHTDGTYRLFSVIEGNGRVDGYELKKGTHFIVPSNYETYHLEGNMTLISPIAKEER